MVLLWEATPSQILLQMLTSRLDRSSGKSMNLKLRDMIRRTNYGFRWSFCCVAQNLKFLPS